MADPPKKTLAQTKEQALVCGINPETKDGMSKVVSTNLGMVKGDGTHSYTGERVLSGKEAFCMGVPGSVDERPAYERWAGKLKSAFSDAVNYVTGRAADVAATVTNAPAQAANGWKEYSGADRTERELARVAPAASAPASGPAGTR